MRRSSIWHHNGSQSPQGGGADRSSSHDEDAAVAADASLYALEAALSFFRDKDCNVSGAMRVDENGKRVVDVTKFRARERRVFIEKLIKCFHALHILGIDICLDTLVGDAMTRGISGGQKKRFTTGEMMVGPTRALFMDEITNGLDSCTAYEIVFCLQQMVHVTDATTLVSLLQPATEAFDLFDDLILMSEGKTVYHGPCDQVLDFFEDCGFRCPQRKGIADFLLEVTSRKEQAQCWYITEVPYSYVSVDMLCKTIKESPLGKRLEEELSEPYDKSQNHKNALSFSMYSLSKWQLFSACMTRELLLFRRQFSVNVIRTTQVTAFPPIPDNLRGRCSLRVIYGFRSKWIAHLVIMALITVTTFWGPRMDISVSHSNSYMGSLSFILLLFLVDGFPEMAATISRLQVFYKQKELCFYPAWAYAIPATVLKVPFSFVQALVWTCLTYYPIGYTPELQWFLYQVILLFAVHLSSASMSCFLALVFQTMVVYYVVVAAAMLLALLFGGLIIAKLKPTFH
ncbi:hypothetical protein TIFTF001_013313 [Ficus carica]|uniref:ABC transporter domain-containing protein n=1 Tax=Ficus carica TaxID=3494 RepID=A0AA88D5X7_FICCA|nr:hypothetical protein TIFTF001_013313 [Ficus carica]